MRNWLLATWALAASACTVIPPLPSGKVLLQGQSATTMGMRLAHRSEKVVSTVTGARNSVHVAEVNQLGLNLNWTNPYLGFRRGLGKGGTEFGASITPFLELDSYLRQALWRPEGPRGWSHALQLEATGALTSYSFSAALAGTLDRGSWDWTLAVRGGFADYALWGPNTGWGPTILARSRGEFIDLATVLHFGIRTRSSSALQLLYRIPLGGERVFQTYSYSSSYNGPVDTHYTTSVRPGPTLGLVLHVDSLGFLPYASSQSAVPRRWTPRPSPDQGDAAYHLRLARELEAAGLLADAADEYLEVQRQDPDCASCDAALARIYRALDEPEMGRFHERAAAQRR